MTEQLDVTMPWIEAALNTSTAESMLRRTIRLDELDAGSLSLRSQRLVRHRAGRRAVIEHNASGTLFGKRRNITLMAKTRAKGLDYRTARHVKQLRDAGFGDDSTDGISVPRVAGVVPEWRMWLSVKAEGVTATDALLAKDGARLARRIAEAALKINKCGVRTSKAHSIHDEISVLDDALKRASAVHPRFAGRLWDVSLACRELAASAQAGSGCTHRDFYGDQIIVAHDRLFIVDLHQLSQGDAELDIGNFLAHITEQSLRVTGDSRSLDDIRGALTEQTTGAGASAEKIMVYDVMSLARHVWISTRIHERNHLTETILVECERRLAQVRTEKKP